MTPIQARRFVGRSKEMWDLHGKLKANRISIITGEYGQTATQVRGLGGNGKSLLAREYSIRFGPAYPGGVFWLNAYRNEGSKGSVSTEEREALRQDQIREFAIRLQVPIEGLAPKDVETRFWNVIEKRGEPCLWMVDDVPSGLTAGELEKTWIAHWPKASTLITTQSREYGAIGTALDLGVLSPKEALDLLTSHRQTLNSGEEHAAQTIVELLGCHPLAVEVAGGYLAQGFESFLSYAQAFGKPDR